MPTGSRRSCGAAWRRAREGRFQSAEDLAFDLEGERQHGGRRLVHGGPGDGGGRASRAKAACGRSCWRRRCPRRWRSGSWLGCGTQPEGSGGPAPTAAFQISLPAALRLPVDDGPCLTISPDGGLIVFAGETNGEQQLYRRPRSQVAFAPIPGTTGARSPFFSPDGEWIGFGADGHLKKLSLRDGREVILCAASQVMGACWAGADSIVFAPDHGSPLMIVSAAGGGAVRSPVSGPRRRFSVTPCLRP